MMTDMEFNEVLLKRRSTRAFTDKPITSEQVEKLLTAAINAPSACNMQSWHFFAVMDSGIRKKFSEFCAPWAATAPVIFIVCTDGEAIIKRFGERANTFIIQDTALAAENLLLCAADMGFNGCFMGSFDSAKCRQLLNIPEKYNIVALIPVGEAQTVIPNRERKPLSEVADIIGSELTIQKSDPKPFTLKGASLPNALFDDLNLAGARFNNINMTNVRYSDINLTGACFGGLCMNSTSFGCVDMKNAVFDNPDLSGTSFCNCNLSNVKLTNCELENMTIDGINVTEAIEFFKKNK
jgi:nitroreductase